MQCKLMLKLKNNQAVQQYMTARVVHKFHIPAHQSQTNPENNSSAIPTVHTVPFGKERVFLTSQRRRNQQLNVMLVHPPTRKPPASVHLHGGLYRIVNQLTHFLHEQQIREIIPSLKKGAITKELSTYLSPVYLPLSSSPGISLSLPKILSILARGMTDAHKREKRMHPCC